MNEQVMFRPETFAASVIIPTFDRAELLEDTLASLERSSASPESFEIIVVDDGSSDDTFERVRARASSRPIKYVFQPDRGFRAGRARNLGIALAEGEICILLDSGVLAAPSLVGAHVAAHRNVERTVAIGYVYGFENGDEGTEDLRRSLVPGDVEASCLALEAQPKLRDIRERAYALCDDNLNALPAPWALGWTCNLSVRRQRIQETGGFDEAFRSWGAEDLDFCLALYRAGASFTLRRDAMAVHAPHPKDFEANKRSSRPNKIYLHSKYNLDETRTLIDTQAVDLNAALLNASR